MIAILHHLKIVKYLGDYMGLQKSFEQEYFDRSGHTLKDEILSLVDKGITATQASRLLGISLTSTQKYAKRYKVAFKHYLDVQRENKHGVTTLGDY